MRARGVLESRVEDATREFMLQLMRKSSLRRANPGLGRRLHQPGQ
jgi:hypothetical protein